MNTKYLYWGMLALSCGYALWRGRSDERIAAGVCIAASLVTLFLIGPSLTGFHHLEMGIFLVDLAVLAVFVAVALTSTRFWPLWIAGLQLTTLLAHVFRMMSSDLIPVAYAAAGRFWSYPILIILLVGTWRHQRRTRRDELSPA